MKKFLVLILVILGLSCCMNAMAETTELLYEGEDGLVRDAAGMIYGETGVRVEWIKKMHEQGNATTAVAYRPLTIRNGIVRTMTEGKIVGYTAEYVGELGDSRTGIVAAGAAGAAALAGLAVAAKKRRCA